MYLSILLLFTIFSFAISIIYLYVFSKNKENALKIWGNSWIVYSVSLLFLVLFLNYDKIIFLELRKIADMFNLLLLLFGVYAFIHIKIPAYWYRFSLYLVLLSIICMIYNFELFSFYLPITVYQIIITIFIIYIIIKKWQIPKIQKYVSILVFSFWGLGKALLSFSVLFPSLTYNSYLIEIIFSNIVYFYILTIYIEYIQNKEILTKELYRTVVENAKDAIFYYKIRPFDAFEYVSPSIEELTGYTPADFYKNPRMFVQLVSENYFDVVEDAFKGNIAKKDKHIMPISQKNGKTFWGEINFTVLFDEEKNPYAVEGILRDITSMKSSEIMQIKEKENRNKQLSYISHELRTPLTLMAGYLAAMEDGIITDEEEKKEAMKIITSKVMLLKSLIEDLEQVTKLETHQFTFSFMTYTAGDITESLIAENTGDLEAAEADFDFVYNIEKLHRYWIVADQNRINQVFSNLLTNAIKYSKANKRIIVSFDVDYNEKNFIVTVKDNGMGIPPEELPYIFERFYRVRNDDIQARGSGLGLTISKEIIEAHGGEIVAKSSPEKIGSTFSFKIPLYKE